MTLFISRDIINFQVNKFHGHHIDPSSQPMSHHDYFTVVTINVVIYINDSRLDRVKICIRKFVVRNLV